MLAAVSSVGDDDGVMMIVMMMVMVMMVMMVMVMRLAGDSLGNGRDRRGTGES